MIEKAKEIKNNQNNQTFFQTPPPLQNGYTIEPYLPPQGAGQISVTLMLSTASANQKGVRLFKEGIKGGYEEAGRRADLLTFCC